MHEQPVTLRIDHIGEVDALWQKPNNADTVFVFAHGAGAGMQHQFMNAITSRLLERNVAVLRYQFPYMQRGSRRPDSAAFLQKTVAAAVETARELAPQLPVFAGGKSMGGRMTSQAAAAGTLPDVRGIIFVGFPLHPAAKPATKRADHLRDVTLPMLFLQGTRDKLADLRLLKPICTELGSRGTLHVVADADHSFHVLKRSGRSDADVLDELADAMRSWLSSTV